MGESDNLQRKIKEIEQQQFLMNGQFLKEEIENLKQINKLLNPLKKSSTLKEELKETDLKLTIAKLELKRMALVKELNEVEND